MPKASLKDQLLEVNEDYLGPAAERFIDRQIMTHLGKPPGQITSKDITTLIDWLKLSFSLLTDDTATVNEYIMRLKLIASGRGEEAIGEKWANR
jgi:hypothetical protein